MTKTLADETISQKAMAEIDAEERRLQERRNTIAGILGKKVSETATADESASDGRETMRSSRRGKSSE